ncbi:MAG: AsmA-like C-terminal region-containing protein, partial [Gammaproteobacteria bacterium]
GSIPFELQRDERRTVMVSSLRGVRFDYLKLLNKDVMGKAIFGVTLATGRVRTRLQLSGNTLYLTVPGQEVAWGANAAASQPFIHDLPGNFSLSGHGRLRLSLMVPLAAPAKMRAYGLLQVNDGRLQAGSLPALTTVAGNVHFSNKNAKGQLIGIWAGQLATVDFDNTQVTVRAAIEAQTALSFLDVDDLPVFGIIPFNLQRDERRTVMVSSLRGVRFDYPAPLNKEAMEKATLSITAAAGMVRARLQLRRNILHLTAQKRGVDLAINAISLPPPARGLQVHGTMADVDVGLWLSGEDTTNAQIAVSLTLVRANFADVIQQTMILHSPFVVRDERQIAITADSVAGVARLGKKHLYLDLARLSLSPPQSEGGGVGDLVFSLLRQMTISLTTQRLQMGSVTLGVLQLNGAPMDANVWILNTLAIINESSTLAAAGGYFDDTATVSVRLWTSDAPAFLQIFSVSNVVSEGAAEMGGVLTWPRPPIGFSLSNLRGRLQMRASDLRYLKGGESVVGLLAIFSPQSLLSLGFVELGKEGTFINNMDGDIILKDGKAEVHNWKMKNDDFSISMEGNTDLAMRTLNLHGRVRPGNRLLKAGSLVSIGVAGAAAVQPLSLVAYWLAGKVFERPLAEIGAYNYTITGTWDSPIYKESGVTLKQSASEDAKK